ncbi:3-oxoacyl-[acyl-carrier-protein] synthase, mitochondrial-like isoform X2 [Actinia tenebrosa]|uniref:3-oxoacyl-[acyl-carrier-protein] synthase n=1 Tax=Actinia tenebrosa TaxID=6105 RepID=A0A6P8I7V7_ACTTE|nr:3-oxoacyl-[acyl-carrier-protein] synthase, mitochondrial-like isoform X2 [Actinia tenebrosa]
MNKGCQKCFVLQRRLLDCRKSFCSKSSRTLSKTRGEERRRVVVTGLGLVCPLGVGTKHVWQQLISGRCGITKITDKAGFVPKGAHSGQLDIDEWLKVVDKRSTSEESLFAVIAASEALKDSKWKPTTELEKQRTGVCIGSGIGGIKDIPVTGAILKKEGYRKVSPFFVPRILVNMPAGVVSMHFELQGPNHAAATACAAGAHAIGDAYRMIMHGDADVMVAGGAESCISPLSMAGFCKARALTTKYNDNPLEASRPFDKDRSGFVMGEGAGILVLEERTHAISRGAEIHAEILGYGMSGDAYHITAPREDGQGAYLAMSAALRDAGLQPRDISYINAHATSTPIGDAIENRAIQRLLGDHNNNDIKVSSTKGATGHLLGAAGAVEAIFTVLALKHKMAPPTLNLHSFDSPQEFTLNYVPNSPQELNPTSSSSPLIALTSSFGFGGTNACLCIGEENS